MKAIRKALLFISFALLLTLKIVRGELSYTLTNETLSEKNLTKVNKDNFIKLLQT